MLEILNRPLRSAIALALVLPLLGVASPVLADATQAQCDAEWAESAADAQCSDETITPSGGDCTIHARCKTRVGSEEKASITVDLESVSDLNNCNGVLTNGTC